MLKPRIFEAKYYEALKIMLRLKSIIDIILNISWKYKDFK